MAYIDFITEIHKKAARNYLERVARGDKAECAAIAKEFGREYWDGDRKNGYGGFKYDGRWAGAAGRIIKHYGLTDKSSVLDVGCAKGFLLYELKKLLPGLAIAGLDISRYAIENSKEEARPYLKAGTASALPYADKSFDLVLSINTLHNLYIYDLEKAMREIMRVTRKNAWIVVESYRNEREKDNLLNWQLTCECFFTPQEWDWIFDKFGYKGDHCFIYFE